jgi:membrane-associated protein
MALIDTFMAWLATHKELAYLILFLGMYFETLVITSVILPGEIFLLAGPVLAGIGALNPGLVILALYGGAVLGDSSSYEIGRRFGTSLFKEGRLIFNPKNYQKGEAFFKKHGLKSIFLSRLLGPVSWITPFLAGTYAIPYRKFLKYNLLGIFVGIGQFIVVGYFFANNYETIIKLVGRYTFFTIAIIISIFVIIWYVRKNKLSNDQTQI